MNFIIGTAQNREKLFWQKSLYGEETGNVPMEHLPFMQGSLIFI